MWALSSRKGKALHYWHSDYWVSEHVVPGNGFRRVDQRWRTACGQAQAAEPIESAGQYYSGQECAGCRDRLAEVQALDVQISGVVDRFPGTQGSRQARTAIREHLGSLGLAAMVERCRLWQHLLVAGARQKWSVYFVLIGYALLKLWVYYKPLQGILVLLSRGRFPWTPSIALIVLFVVDMVILYPVWREIIRPSGHNLSVRFGPNDPQNEIVVVAHYDTFRPTIGLEVTGAALLRLSGSRRLRHLFGRNRLCGFSVVLGGALVFIAIAVSLLYLAWRVAPPVPFQWLEAVILLWCFDAGLQRWSIFTDEMGSNDNGTGIAVLLRLAERLATDEPTCTAVHLVFSDGEELAAQQGFRAWLKTHPPHPGVNRFVVAVDSIGEGHVAVHLPSTPAVEIEALGYWLDTELKSSWLSHTDACAAKGPRTCAVMAITKHGAPLAHWDDGFSVQRWEMWQSRVSHVAAALHSWIEVVFERESRREDK